MTVPCQPNLGLQFSATFPCFCVGGGTFTLACKHIMCIPHRDIISMVFHTKMSWIKTNNKSSVVSVMFWILDDRQYF